MPKLRCEVQVTSKLRLITMLKVMLQHIVIVMYAWKKKF
nr:MAG TPA: hypothetical protein [Caudoviricetes sp.]